LPEAATPPGPDIAAPVAARDAASLIVLGPGPSVLMGMRGAGHRFMPNRLVFPGGAVDPADAVTPVASPLPPATRALLERHAPPDLAHALAVAAARELEEETGLSLGRPPALDGIFYLCRAVTPPRLPLRFNARFLVVAAERLGGTLGGSGELEDLRWYPVGEVRTLDLAFVTRGVLGHLGNWLALAETREIARDLTPVCLDANWSWE
jgi:8-oxo-dGTP pyrophosphatase MutT (NUDIX family)